jgi:type I restriction enzyme M protein
VLEPERGTVLDPACGSGGMFVQSARIVEERGQSPTGRLTFRGLEKNATTIRLAKMNLAVHGLEGDIQKAITYYEDPHELLGKADYVMANPPFNVDEIDADKVKNDLDGRGSLGQKRARPSPTDCEPRKSEPAIRRVWPHRGG